MKRSLYISFVCAATMALFAISIVPHHHHHGAEVCVANHLCGGGACDDDHHPQGAEGAEHAGGCVAETLYYHGSERDHKCCDAPDRDHDGHTHLFVLENLFSELSFDEPSVATGYGEYQILYKSVHILSGGGLRAPPTVLC